MGHWRVSVLVPLAQMRATVDACKSISLVSTFLHLQTN